MRTYEKRLAVLRIMDLCVKITDKGIAHAFCSYSGHVQWLEVRVLPTTQVYAQRVEQTPLYKATLLLNSCSPDSLEVVVNHLQGMLGVNHERV